MQLLDYVIKTGEKQGNSKHFQNFLKIHSHMMKIEKQNEDAKYLINDKTAKLIKMEANERLLKSKISGLEIELQKMNKIIEDKDNQIKDLIRDNELDFKKALDSWSLKK